jgi:hypothetical protein
MSTNPYDLPQNDSLPRIWCDFNACGWSGEEGDDCFYAFDRKALNAINPSVGMRVFIYDEDGDNGEIIGCVGQLEQFNSGWRIRPVGEWVDR